VLTVGYGASWFFPADPNVKSEWTFWGWLEKRKMLNAEKIISPTMAQVNP